MVEELDANLQETQGNGASSVADVPRKGDSLPERIFNWVEAVFSSWASGVLLVFVMFFISAEIIGRFLVNHSFLGIVDIVELCVLVLTFIALSITQKHNAHISMDLVTNKYTGSRTGYIIDSVNLVLMLLVAVFLFYVTAVYTGYLNSYHIRSDLIKMPVVPWAVFMPIGCAVFIVRAIFKSIDSVKKIL